MIAPPVIQVEACPLEGSDGFMARHHRQLGHLHGYLSRHLHLTRLDG
jgi:hypothetical protein